MGTARALQCRQQHGQLSNNAAQLSTVPSCIQCDPLHEAHTPKELVAEAPSSPSLQ